MTPHTIKALYTLALAEGEGMGTAYEYYIKRMLLRSWLVDRPAIGRLLIAGLPEKYGSSLDFFLLAKEAGVDLVVADERPAAVQQSEKALAEATLLAGLKPLSVRVPDLASLEGLEGAKFDLILSSEVLQRLPLEAQPNYVRRLIDLAPRIALFAPNAGNLSHTIISGLAGVNLDELQSMLARLATERSPNQAERTNGHGSRRAAIRFQCGYLDLPPFPPGITRSESQRQQAERGWLEALAMRGLERYAHLERYVPAQIKQRRAHIVYALISGEL